MKNLKKILIILLLVIGIFLLFKKGFFDISSGTPERHGIGQSVSIAFQKRLSGVQVTGSGRVIRILSDDNMGDRHQRFIIRVDSRQTVLVAHNIDIAKRIDELKKGDVVDFYGEYEWNSRGGILHWTHHDPKGRHTGGWLKHRGRIYR